MYLKGEYLMVNTREFQEADFELCVNLYIKVFNDEPWNDKWTCKKAKGYLGDMVNTPGFEGFVIMKDFNIVGFIFGYRKQWWEGDIFFLHEMCIDTSVQGKGFGTILMDYAKNYLILNEFSTISLITERLFPAAAFYMKQGFEESKETRLFNYILK